MPSNSTDPRPDSHGAVDPRDGTPERSSPWANLLLAVVATAALFLLIEGTASLLMSAREARHALQMREESHAKYDADLGWSNLPGLSVEDMYGNKTRFTTNAQGLRARENFDKGVPGGRYRMIALGDSFTMGHGVGDESTYPSQMQAQCPILQPVNMGQGGYGADQSYLWYKRDGVKLDADLLLFALIAENFYRMGSDNFIGYAKPVLRARNGALVIENVPVPRTWDTRTRIRQVGTFLSSLAVVRTGKWIAGRVTAPAAEKFYGALGDEVLAAAELALDELARLSEARGQRFVLAYLPVRNLLAKEPTREAQWLEDYARRKGVAFVSLVSEFERLTPAQLDRMFLPDFHYSAEGNHLVAQAMLRRVAEVTPGFPKCEAAAAR